ncbi:hypothetical protein RJ639_005746, partial [Escallonia herrerae]
MSIVLRLHRSLVTAKPAATPATALMLHTRGLQNCTGTYLQCRPFRAVDKFEIASDLNSKKARVSCIFSASYSKVLRIKSQRNCHPIRSCAYGSQSALANQPHLGVAFHNTATPMHMLSNGFLDGGVRFGAPSFGGFAKRSFSRVPRAVPVKVDNASVRNGRTHGSTSSFKWFSKNQKWAKPLADGKNFEGEMRGGTPPQAMRKGTSASKLPALNDVDHGKKDADIGVSSVSLINDILAIKSKGKPKQQSRSKRNQEPSSDANASPDAVAEPASATKVSQAKKRSPPKNEQSPLVSENSSSSNVPVEVLDGAVSPKKQPKKKTRNFSKKDKPLKEANASIEAPKRPSGKELSQKDIPHMTGKYKPQVERAKRPLYPPTSKSVLVVESVAKAKVIQGYLGDMFEVLPSYGHIRDLAARSGSVRPDDDFSMVWEVPSAAWTHLKSIKVALNGTENLILASDPDREGEAIAWHIIEMLQQQDALGNDITVSRVVFNEITESSIKSALQAPRDIDEKLVHAYLARRALDYLIGFNISPLLWRKLPGCQSAGRVQSAALSLICDREMEIDDFKAEEYWTVEAEFTKMKLGSPLSNFSISSHMTHFDTKKLSLLSISSHTEACDIQQRINSTNFKVASSKRSKIRKNPPAPYITSTLQQDAANKLHFSTSYTMKLAQKLYEGLELSDGKATGLITYMRTDGLHISDEAATDIQSMVKERYGEKFASGSARKYFKKVKNAQEAHEAIRPTDIRRYPSKLVGILDEDSLKLYTLIWSRTVACQMEVAIIDQLQIDIGDADRSIVFRSGCSKLEFLGYRAAYEDVETRAIRYDDDDGNDHNETFNILSHLKSGDPLDLGKVELKQHYTSPPPRYSEASLVKKMEELGIGRPSTYASTLKVLQDRNYVTAKSRVLCPEFRGRMLSAFLSHHFSEVTDYSFTADMENELDNVSAGMTEWKGLLRDYWTRFSKYCEVTSNVHIHQVEKMLEKTFGDLLFASLPNKCRTCPSCREGTLIFKVSRFGAGYFIGCDQHPKCKYIAKTLFADDDEDVLSESSRSAMEEPKVLGLNPGSEEKILLKNGPYGHYVQLGEDRKGYLPKRASISQIKDVNSVTLEEALALLRYPVTLGKHPEDGQPVVLKLAKLGFSIRHRRHIAPVPKNLKPEDINMEKALELLSGKDVRRCGRPKTKGKLKEAVEF